MPAIHLPAEQQQRAMTSTAKSDQIIGNDVLRRLFDPIIHGERFRCWWLGTDEPQLRLHGAPGSGKTTFVVVAAQHLRKHEKSAITVFIQPHDAWNHKTLRDIMHCVLAQLHSQNNTIGIPESYFQESTSNMRERMHQAIAQRLMKSSPLFLLVDGSDSIDISFHQILEHELSELQKLGVKVLVTSRYNCDLTPAFFKPAYCDFCDTEVQRQDGGVEALWECNGEKPHAACNSCYSSFPFPKVCQYGEHGCQEGRRMTHPYQYSLVDMDTALGSSMHEFICWNMENEHGDLGLGLVEKSEISLSKLGIQLRQRESSNTARAIADRIKQNAGGNVAMARLRLDILHGLNDVGLIDAQAGITPLDVISLFNLAFDSTQRESVPIPQRRLALKAMAIVSNFSYLRGVSFDTINHVIKMSEAEQDGIDPTKVLSVNEIALSTQGLLVFGINKWLPFGAHQMEKPLYAYSQTFHTYLREDNQPVKDMAVKLGSILERSEQSWDSLARWEERLDENEEDLG